jgi:hypothetical protein
VIHCNSCGIPVSDTVVGFQCLTFLWNWYF